MTRVSRERILLVLSGLLGVGCNTQKETQPLPEPAASVRAPLPVELAEPANPARPATAPAASAPVEAREVPRAPGAQPSGSAAAGKEHRCTPGGCAPGKCA